MPSPTDVLFNTAGTVMGWFLAHTAWWWRQAKAEAPRITRVHALGALAIVGTILFLLTRSVDYGPRDFSNWNSGGRLLAGHGLGSSSPWFGELQAVALLSRAVSAEQISDLSKSRRDVLPDSIRGITAFERRTEGPGGDLRGFLDEGPGQFDNLIPSGELTVLAWIRPSTVEKRYWGIVLGLLRERWVGNFVLTERGGRIGFDVRTPAAGGNLSVRTQPLLTSGKNYFVAAAFDGDYCRIYVDGKEVTSHAVRGRGRWIRISRTESMAVSIGLTILVMTGLSGAFLGRGLPPWPYRAAAGALSAALVLTLVTSSADPSPVLHAALFGAFAGVAVRPEPDSLPRADDVVRQSA
jgi:hypothetical protein